MMYGLKKLVGSLLMPFPIALALWLVGVLLLMRGRLRAAYSHMIIGALLLFLSALGPAADALLGSLEERYPPMLKANGHVMGVRFVVVLGSSYFPESNRPVTGALVEAGMVRLAEGVRLFRQLPGSKFVVSGGSMPGQAPSAWGYARAARELGVPEEAIVQLDQSLDTADEARALKTLLANAPFVLVTSAFHMTRAIAHCQRAGLSPIPAPAGYLVHKGSSGGLRHWIPSAEHMRKTERAMHEYLGLFAMKLGLD